MYSGGAYSEFPYGEHSFTPAVAPAFEAWLAKASAPRCWLLELEALSLAAPGGISAAYSDGAYSQAGYGADEGVTNPAASTLRYSTHGYTAKYKGYALNFNGVDQYGTISGNAGLDSNTEFAIEAWITDLDDGSTNFSLSRDDLGANRIWFVRRNSNTVGVYSVFSANGTQRSFSPAGSWKISERFHMIFTCWVDGSVIRLEVFINGVSVGADSFDAVAIKTAPTLGILLSTRTAAANRKRQILDGVRFYTRRIAAAEAADHYNGLYTDNTGLTINLPCDEGSGDIANDTSGNGNHCTLVAGPTWVPGAYNGAEERHWYDGRLAGDIIVDRAIVGRNGIGGLARTVAAVSLVNSDGGLDTLTDDYALDGRRATLWLGRPDDARPDFGLVVSGVVERITTSLSTMRIQLSDGLAKLDAPIQETTYAGTGGVEGGADLKGKPKPLAFGKSFNVPAVLVDGANLIYQVHAGGPIKDVPAVYDRGVVLIKVAGAPGAGQYQVDTAAGTFKLGATPAGTVTCDVEGDASLTGYVDRTADIIMRILVQKAALASYEIDSASFGRLNTDAGAPVGIWIGSDTRTIAEVVDELLENVGAYGGFARLGAFTVGLVAAASGSPKASFTEEDITGLELDPLPDEVGPVVWRARVAYQKNYTIQEDLAASVLATRKTFTAEEVRVATKEDAAIQSRHLLAREFGPGPGLYVNESDADAEALRRFNLWGTPRNPYRVATRPRAMLVDFGDVVDLTHRRIGLGAGAAARVIGHTIRGTRVELKALV